VVTRFLLHPEFADGLQCTDPDSDTGAFYGWYRQNIQFDKLFYGPPSTVSIPELQAVLPVGSWYGGRGDPVTNFNKSVSVTSPDNLHSKIESIVESNNYLYAIGGIYVDDSAPIFAFQSNEWNTPGNALSAQSTLNQVLMNTTIAVSSSELQTPYVPNDFLQGVIAVFVVLGFAVYPGFFSLYPTSERVQNVRAMQYSNGESIIGCLN
jgi:hypothetical protein